MVKYHPAIGLGWLGLLLAPAHPADPNWATGVLTAAGLALWFFSGLLAVMLVVWGG